MILLSGRNRLAVAFLVSAAVVVLSCSFGGGRARAQSTAPTDSAARARQAAKDWALKIFDEIGQKPNEDKRVTFQPLDDRDVASSRHRRRLYGWMLSALHERGRVWKYSVMNPMDSRHVAEAFEAGGCAGLARGLREDATEAFADKAESVVRRDSRRESYEAGVHGGEY